MKYYASALKCKNCSFLNVFSSKILDAQTMQSEAISVGCCICY